MDIKIYAGTIGQYYNENWCFTKDDNHQYFKIINSKSLDDYSFIKEHIASWQQQIIQIINQDLKHPDISWLEEPKSYFTASFLQEAFSALIMMASSVINNIPYPKTIKLDNDLENHELIQKALNDEKYHWSLFNGTTCFLPVKERLNFYGPTPTEQIIVYATTGSLLDELKQINQLIWNQDKSQIIKWSTKQIKPDNVNNEYDIDNLAKLAYSLLYQALLFAINNNVPIILSY